MLTKQTGKKLSRRHHHHRYCFLVAINPKLTCHFFKLVSFRTRVEYLMNDDKLVIYELACSSQRSNIRYGGRYFTSFSYTYMEEFTNNESVPNFMYSWMRCNILNCPSSYHYQAYVMTMALQFKRTKLGIFF